MKKPTKERAPVGRPSKYDPTYCDLVVETLGDGHSLAGFAGKIGVARSTINEWMAEHAEFSEACTRAKAASVFCWERHANRVAVKGGGPGTAQVIVFALRNMAPDDWANEKRARISIPKITSAKTAMEAMAEATAAFTRGEIDAPHAETIVAMAKSFIAAAETVDLESRLAALEQGGVK